MNRENAAEIIRAALLKATGQSDLEYGDETHLVGSELLDSLDASVFLLELEKASGKQITDQDVEIHDLYHVSKLTDWLCR